MERLQNKIKELATYLPQDCIFSITGQGWDCDVVNKEVVMTNELDTAVFMGVECNKRATAEQIANPLFRRGHFTNLVFQGAHEVGSLKWFYTEQGTVTNELQENLTLTLEESLGFLVTDSRVAGVAVAVNRVVSEPYALEAIITLTESDASVTHYKLFTQQ